MAEIPGAPASHSIISDDCRAGRGDDGAFEEAVDRARQAYEAIVSGWKGQPSQPTFHLALTYERP